MRILSIGCPIPSPQVDNHSIANAPSIFDYDACIIDPRAVSEQIEGLAQGTLNLRSPDGRPVAAGESGAFHFGLGELLAQRRLELQQLVERGGLIVLFLHPNVRHPSVASFPGLDRYALLPAPDGDPFHWPRLRPADGRDVRPTIPQHPVAAFLDDLAGRMRYRAVLDLPADDGARIVGRSIGGAALAAEFSVSAGKIVALPAANEQLSSSQRKTFAAALLELIERMTGEEASGNPPHWVSRFDSPDAADARQRLTEANAALTEAQRRVTEARALLDDTTRFQALLWRSDGAFEETVREAFRVLGYTVAGGGGPIELRDGSETALLELASSNAAVSDRVYLTLQQRIEDRYLSRRSRPKGIIVASGQRQTDPRVRRNVIPQTLINACETYGYTLIPVEALFELVSFALDESDEPEALADLRQSIAETAGVLEIVPEDEDDEEAEAAPAGSNGATVRA